MQANRNRSWPFLILAALFFPAPLPAQEKTTLYVGRFGTDVFANLLHEEGLKPLARIEQLGGMDPRQTVVIVLGKIDRIREISRQVGGLRNYLDAGGALLIATNFPDAGVLTELGIGISGFQVYQRERESQFLGIYPDCPILEPPLGGPHPLLQDARLPLVAMRPSTFTFYPPGLVSVARYGPWSFLPFGWGGLPSPIWEPHALASPAGQGPVGRQLYLTGHGLFMNGLLIRKELGNFAFSRRAVRWLAEGPHGPRTHVLLLESRPGESSKIVDKLDLPLTQPEIPWGALMNLFADQIQRQGLLEQFFRENTSASVIWRWVLIAISVLAVPLLLRRMFLARFRRDNKAVLLIGLQNPPPPALPLSQQRQAELARGGNLSGPARVLVRQWLGEMTGNAEAWPPFIVQGSWWRRRGLRRDLDWLRRLAGEGTAGALTARQFRRLPEVLARLTQASRAGELQIAPGAGSGPNKIA